MSSCQVSGVGEARILVGMQTSTHLERRGLRPPQELARERQHGDRLRYMAGCRCEACRRANSQYESDRSKARKAGDWNGIVPAQTAREHLAKLSSAGVGRRTVSDVTSIADTVLAEIISGRKANIRARTERLILAVTPAAAADRALTSATATWQRVSSLLAEGMSKAQIARELGYKSPAIQFGRDQVTVRTAYEVERLFERKRMCNAKKSEAILARLRAEGFHSGRIKRELASVAERLGHPEPDITITNGRILASSARLIERLHDVLLSDVSETA